MDAEKKRELVRRNYTERAQSDERCCAPGRATPQAAAVSGTVLDAGAGPTSTEVGYRAEDLERVPSGANMGLGCGTPVELAALQPGETVLDLGSGGGLDCFIASRAVGPEGRVIGVDMTPEMVSRARTSAKDGQYTQVEFRLGEIEHLPVADGEVDVVLSNCVINLSPDKQAVYDECYRALRPGGRIALSDVVSIAEMPDAMREDALLSSCCVGGARRPHEVESMLSTAGFIDIRVEVKVASRQFIKDWVPGSKAEDYVASADITATKPTDAPVSGAGRRARAKTARCCS